MMRRILASLLATLLLAGGCANQDTRSSAQPPQPSSRPGVAERMFVSCGTPTDANGNGYLDTIPVVAYLFPDPEKSAIPVWTTGGTFRFEARAEGRIVAAWEFPPHIVLQSQVRLPPGPGYAFYLRMSPAQDVTSPAVVDLSVVYTRADGFILQSPGVATVRLGRS